MQQMCKYESKQADSKIWKSPMCERERKLWVYNHYCYGDDDDNDDDYD